MLGILLRRLDLTLCISTTTVEEFVDTLIESLNAKDATGFAGVVVMGELFDIFGDIWLKSGNMESTQQSSF